MKYKTDLNGACSVTVENKHFIFGGSNDHSHGIPSWNHPTQVSFNNFNLFILFYF